MKTLQSPGQFCPFSSESVPAAQLSLGSILCSLTGALLLLVSLLPSTHLPFLGPLFLLFSVLGTPKGSLALHIHTLYK